MRRWWVVIALLLSVGVNVGILAALATRRAVRPEAPPPPPPREEQEHRPAPPRSELPPPPPPSQPSQAPQNTEPHPGPPQGGPPPREEPPPHLAPPLPDPAGPLDEGEPEPGQPQGGPPRASRLADRLGLEGEPRRRFLAIQQSFFEETVRIRLHLSETQREVRREMMSSKPDGAKIDALLQESSRDFLALERALAKNVASSRELLNPAQEEEYLLLISRLRPQAPAAPGFGQQPPPPLQRRRPLPPWQQRQQRQDQRRDRNGRFPDDRFPQDRFPDDRRPQLDGKGLAPSPHPLPPSPEGEGETPPV